MAEISDQAALTMAATLTQLLTDREAVPDEAEVLQSGDLSNREVALALIGRRPDGPLPRPGTAERRAYLAAQRSVQRYRAAPGRQRRRPSAQQLPKLREAVRRTVARDRVDRLQRRGARLAITGVIRVSEQARRHRMPAAGMQTVAGPMWRLAIRAWLRGDMREAGVESLAAFFASYWLGAKVPQTSGRSLENPADVLEIELVEAELL
jgi:hypothetical protein